MPAMRPPETATLPGMDLAGKDVDDAGIGQKQVAGGQIAG